MAKAVFVDWASFWNIQRVLGIGKTDYSGFYSVVTRQIGEGSLFGKPICVLTKNFVNQEKPLRSVGFEVVVVKDGTDGNSPDDQEIIKRINSLRAEEVTEILLVSADIADYGDCLRAKGVQEVKIFLAATKKIDPRNNRSVLPMAFEELYMKEPGFNFVELGNFRDQTMREPWVDRLRPQDVPAAEETMVGTGSKKTIKLSLEVSFDDLNEIIMGLSAILGSRKVLKSTLEIN